MIDELMEGWSCLEGIPANANPINVAPKTQRSVCVKHQVPLAGISAPQAREWLKQTVLLFELIEVKFSFAKFISETLDYVLTLL